MSDMTEAQQAAETQFVEEQLARMSLAAKVGQMTMGERMWTTPAQAREFQLGSVLSGGGSHPGDNRPADWVAMNDEYWQAMMVGEGAPGVPLLFGIDAVHGHNNVAGATIFPHNIGLGAADCTDLMGRIAAVTAQEILATGVEWNFAPTLAVAGNPQWGRTYESFGSCPQRAARLGEAYIKALQGEGVIGCVKHWAGDGGTRHGIDQGETALSWEEFERTHIAPYYPALAAGAMTVMVSFNSWNGTKCHGHEHLVSQVLKQDLGFDGIVVSDWDGLKYLDADYSKAVVMSVNAGIDVHMIPEHWQRFIQVLLEAVEQGHVAMDRIDDAVRRILLTKYRYGLFSAQPPAKRHLSLREQVGSSAHRAVAADAVRRSLVLLKDAQSLLPIKPSAKVLVAGRNADNMGRQCGGWTISWQGDAEDSMVEGTTIWEGIRQRVPGATLSVDLSGAEADPSLHEVAIVVIGETPYAEGHGDIRPTPIVLDELAAMEGLINPLEPYGASLELAELHPEDAACIERISAAGVPVVAVLVSGRPLIVNRELEAAEAFVAAWLPGSQGEGVAQVLFGEYGFSGRLPLPWPKAFLQAENSSYSELFEAGFGLQTQPLTEAGRGTETAFVTED